MLLWTYSKTRTDNSFEESSNLGVDEMMAVDLIHKLPAGTTLTTLAGTNAWVLSNDEATAAEQAERGQ